MRHDILDRLNFDQFKAALRLSDVFLAVGSTSPTCKVLINLFTLVLLKRVVHAGSVKSAVGLGMLLS